MDNNGRTRMKVRERKDYAKFSDQPRFTAKKSGRDFFMSLYNWSKEAAETEPLYAAESRKRDSWLRKFIRLEPNLMGVVNTVVDIDKNRGWRMVGGRNQVMSFTNMLHNMQAAPGLFGWRPGVSQQSKSFWGTDMGSILELGRSSKNGPLRALYGVDPARCQLTGDEQYPLHYHPHKVGGKPIKWRLKDFVRVTSLPDDDEQYHGLGYSAVSRCLDLAKLMIAVYDHDREVLGSRAPRGLMMLKGISNSQWEDAMKARETSLDGMERDYFGSVSVLASAGADIDAKFLALSALPMSFNLREWMDMLIFGYAICFGFDASEFWPVQFGALGRGTETEIQHEKATGKGRLDFVLGFQEQLQEFLPDSLSFEFDQRDEKGDLLHAEVNQANVNVVTSMTSGGLLSVEQGQVLLADYGVIPAAWAPTELTQATDVNNEAEKDDEIIDGPEDKKETEVDPEEAAELERQARVRTPKMLRMMEELCASPHIFRAAEKYPTEPIVQYSWPANTVTMLLPEGGELLKTRMWNGIQIDA